MADYAEYLIDLFRSASPYGRWRDWSFMSLVPLEFYIDESESKAAADPSVCVAGFIAQGKKWTDFADYWNKALDTAVPKGKHVEVFHAYDYANRKNSKWGEFRGWTEREREIFINSLTSTVRAYSLRDAGCVIHRSTFKQVVTGKRGHQHGDIYVLAAKVAMVNGARWARRQRFNHAPSFILEQGSTYAGAMRDALKQLQAIPGDGEFFKLSAITEVPKSRAYPQTQPADFAAYYSTKWMSSLSGYDPGTGETIGAYCTRNNVSMPPELGRLLPPKNGITYHTPGSLELLVAAFERGQFLSRTLSILDDDE